MQNIEKQELEANGELKYISDSRKGLEESLIIIDTQRVEAENIIEHKERKEKLADLDSKKKKIEENIQKNNQKKNETETKIQELSQQKSKVKLEIDEAVESSDKQQNSVENLISEAESSIKLQSSALVNFEKELGSVKEIITKNVTTNLQLTSKQDSINKRLDDIKPVKKQLRGSISDNKDDIGRMLGYQVVVEDLINRLLIPETQENSFKLHISLSFTFLVGLVIIGFFYMAKIDDGVRTTIFSSESGIQFLTLFSLVIAIILFGITGILEAKELAALLGGISGYILGRATTPANSEASRDRGSRADAGGRGNMGGDDHPSGSNGTGGNGGSGGRGSTGDNGGTGDNGSGRRAETVEVGATRGNGDGNRS